LKGTGITFGQQADGSGVDIQSFSLLDLQFSDLIDMVDAISMDAQFGFSSIRVEGVNEEINGNKIHLYQETPLSVRANLVSDDNKLRIDFLDAENAELFTYFGITQTGKIKLTGDLFLRTSGSPIVLDNPENDFNQVTIKSGYYTSVQLTDANDLLIGNWDIEDTTVTIRAL